MNSNMLILFSVVAICAFVFNLEEQEKRMPTRDDDEFICDDDVYIQQEAVELFPSLESEEECFLPEIWDEGEEE